MSVFISVFYIDNQIAAHFTGHIKDNLIFYRTHKIHVDILIDGFYIGKI